MSAYKIKATAIEKLQPLPFQWREKPMDPIFAQDNGALRQARAFSPLAKRTQ